MVIFPNAKINLGLYVLRKREDGFHDLETLFYPVGLKDALEYVENGKKEVNLTNSGLNLDILPEQNIVLKAYRMLQVEYPLPGLDIYLHKVIPSGAGLGGGSADAAFFLKSLNEHFELGISAGKLNELAGRLGADCAFFLENTPSIATGKGDRLTPLDLSLKGYHLLLIKPPFGIDTKLAYAGVLPKEHVPNLKEILLKGVKDWENCMTNDFEVSLFPKFPELGRLKTRLYEMGALYVSMSGSGSSMYGIFEDEPAVRKADFPPGYFVWGGQLN